MLQDAFMLEKAIRYDIKGKHYINTPSKYYFEDVLNSYLKIKNTDVYVTGSNSRMLSSDVKTEFRGRGYEIRVHPLSFSEFLKAGQYANELSALQDYMIYGGMPQVVSFSKKKKIISNHCFKGLIYAI